MAYIDVRLKQRTVLVKFLVAEGEKQAYEHGRVLKASGEASLGVSSDCAPTSKNKEAELGAESHDKPQERSPCTAVKA
jgi:hypothetical protein